MTDLALITPEDRYEVTRTQQADFAAISVSSESTPVALAAQWASDVCALQEHLWERYIIASPSPDDEFKKINGYLSAGLYEFTADIIHGDAQDLLHAARNQIADVFSDQSLLDGWIEKCSDTSHLRDRAIPSLTDWEAVRDRHSHAVDVTEVIRRRNEEIQKQSNDLLMDRPRFGDISGHQRVWELDWTVFHAHLLDMAFRCGDDILISVELRWTVAHQKVSALTNVPMGVQDAASRWRGVLEGVVGPMEAAVLSEHFLTL